MRQHIGPRMFDLGDSVVTMSAVDYIEYGAPQHPTEIPDNYDHQGDQNLENTSDTSCAICLDSINLVKNKTVTICKHEFHTLCLRRWTLKAQTCPVCRTRLADD